jgi:hypothetical protein
LVRHIQNPGLTEQIREYIMSKLNQAKITGLTTVDLKSGDIHRSLNLSSRMPAVCSAMVTLNTFKFEIIQDTESKQTSAKVVRYYLN